MEWNGMEWIDGMQCSGMEWINGSRQESSLVSVIACSVLVAIGGYPSLYISSLQLSFLWGGGGGEADHIDINIDFVDLDICTNIFVCDATRF